METIKITKKELKEKGYAQRFSDGRLVINCFWFDWKVGDYIDNSISKRFGGYKFMVAGYNLTKKDVFDAMYNWLTNPEWLNNPYHNPNIKIWSADTDQQRKKLPLTFNWNHW